MFLFISIGTNSIKICCIFVGIYIYSLLFSFLKIGKIRLFTTYGYSNQKAVLQDRRVFEDPKVLDSASILFQKCQNIAFQAIFKRPIRMQKPKEALSNGWKTFAWFFSKIFCFVANAGRHIPPVHYTQYIWHKVDSLFFARSNFGNLIDYSSPPYLIQSELHGRQAGERFAFGVRETHLSPLRQIGALSRHSAVRGTMFSSNTIFLVISNKDKRWTCPDLSDPRN